MTWTCPFCSHHHAREQVGGITVALCSTATATATESDPR